jgi:hypothetical protein
MRKQSQQLWRYRSCHVGGNSLKSERVKGVNNGKERGEWKINDKQVKLRESLILLSLVAIVHF